MIFIIQDLQRRLLQLPRWPQGLPEEIFHFSDWQLRDRAPGCGLVHVDDEGGGGGGAGVGFPLHVATWHHPHQSVLQRPLVLLTEKSSILLLVAPAVLMLPLLPHYANINLWWGPQLAAAAGPGYYYSHKTCPNVVAVVVLGQSLLRNGRINLALWISYQSLRTSQLLQVKVLKSKLADYFALYTLSVLTQKCHDDISHGHCYQIIDCDLTSFHYTAGLKNHIQRLESEF